MPRDLFTIIGHVFNVKKEQITDQTTQDDIEAWDSLNALLLIEEIESEFNIKLPIEDVMEISSVKVLKEILKKHGINLV